METSWVGSFGRIASGAALVAGAMMMPADAALEIGKTVVVVKTVTGQVEQSVRRLVINDGVSQNEIIATEPDAASEIVFLDGTKIAVGPRARITLDKFVFDPDPAKGTFFLTASQGVFRFITGSMAHQSYQIRTPNGTIGVRGTELNILVCEKNRPAKPPGSATDPCDEISGDGTTVEVVEGSAVFTDQSGVQTPLGLGQTRTILGPGAGGNTAGLEADFHADVTAMDTALTIAALNAISPAAGGRGDVVPSPLNADPPGLSRGGPQIGTNGQQGQQGGQGNNCNTPANPQNCQ